jgi:lipoprotein-anchoring transpeptidase ErfK/SrfK
MRTTVTQIHSRPLSLRSVLRRGMPRRHLLIVVAAVCLLGPSSAQAAAARTPTGVRATQQLAVLLTPHVAHRAPRAGSPRMTVISARRPITGEATTLPVIGRTVGPSGIPWLRVMLPGRPNGSTAWIAQQGTRKLVTSWHIVINLSRRRVNVYRDGRVRRIFPAVVGKSSTPTPTGQFFVEETFQMTGGEPGGPYALALSARSNVLQEFEGGPGQIALHGRDNLGGTLGSAESHGCVRLDTSSITWLISHINPGTPVTIY